MKKKYGYNDKFTVHPVGLKSCDVFGVYDLAGNVAEWLNDNGYFSSNNRKLTSITMENEGERHFINHLPAGVSGTGLGFRIVSKDVTNIHLNRSSFEFNPNILTGRYQLFENGKRTLGYLEIREEVLAVVSPSFEKVPVLLGFFDDKPHHFHIWYNNVICEGEGYFPSLYIQNKNTIIIYSNARYVFRYEEPVFSN